MSEAATSYEKALSNVMFQERFEKSFTDKLLNKDDNKRLQQLMKKSDLNEDEIHEILHLISTTGNKLVNFNDWDRYLLGKDFAWVREFATQCVNIMNWEEETEQKIEAIEELLTPSEVDKNLDKHDLIVNIIDNIEEEKSSFDENHLLYKLKVLNETLEIIKRIKQDFIHNFKFMVDVFNYLSSSTLSLGAAAFDKLSTNSFEYHYPEIDHFQGQQQPRSRFNFNLRGR